MSATPATRQLVLLCDGTSNNVTGKVNDTHVVALAEWLAAHPDPLRTTFYDPGVGNPGELPGATVWDQIRRTFDRRQGLAFGRGVFENMAECYLFLMQHYQPGDQIYLFGFSRGAFTARSVAGLVNQFGVLQAHMTSMLPTLLHVYFAERNKSTHWNAIAEQSARLFTHANTRKVPIHFVGVWDTVASVGLPPFGAKMTALPTASGKQFIHVRQALALDEHRLQFTPRLYAGDNGPFKTVNGGDGDLVQQWFAGSHCDVGGGYPVEQAQLSQAPLIWLTNEAQACGLRVAPLAAVPTKPPVVHSQTLVQPLWALTGLRVRNPHLVLIDGQTPMPITPQSGTQGDLAPSLSYSRNAAWSRAKPTLAHRLSLLAALIWMLAIGQSLVGAPATGSVWGDFGFSIAHWRDYLQANGAFQQWQLTAWLLPDPSSPLAAWASPAKSLFWDVGLIATYAYALSWWAAKAFATVAGLRSIDSPPTPWLNRLGLALPLAVCSDLLENALSASALVLMSADLSAWARPVLCLLAVCSVLKWLGLAGVAALVVGSKTPRLRSGQ